LEMCAMERIPSLIGGCLVLDQMLEGASSG
jgi:hypothetical protein